MSDINYRNFYFPEDQQGVVVYEGRVPFGQADNRVYHKLGEVLNYQHGEVSTYEYPEEPGIPPSDRKWEHQKQWPHYEEKEEMVCSQGYTFGKSDFPAKFTPCSLLPFLPHTLSRRYLQSLQPT